MVNEGNREMHQQSAGPLYSHVSNETMTPTEAVFYLIDICQVVHSLASNPTSHETVQKAGIWFMVKELVECLLFSGGGLDALTRLTVVLRVTNFSAFVPAKTPSHLCQLLSDGRLMDIFFCTVQQPLSAKELEVAIGIVKLLQTTVHMTDTPRWMPGFLFLRREQTKKLRAHPLQRLADRWLSFETELQTARTIARRIRRKIQVPFNAVVGNGQGNLVERFKGANIHFCDNPLVRSDCPSLTRAAD